MTSRDAELFEQLRKLLRDQPTEGLVDQAKQMWDLRSIDEEVAGLATDSFESLPVGVRRAASLERDLTFEFEGVELSLRFDGPDVLGQLLGEDVLSGQLVTTDGETPLDIDDLGSFVADRPDCDLLRVALVTNSGRRLSTEWVRL